MDFVLLIPNRGAGKNLLTQVKTALTCARGRWSNFLSRRSKRYMSVAHGDPSLCGLRLRYYHIFKPDLFVSTKD